MIHCCGECSLPKDVNKKYLLLLMEAIFQPRGKSAWRETPHWEGAKPGESKGVTVKTNCYFYFSLKQVNKLCSLSQFKIDFLLSAATKASWWNPKRKHKERSVCYFSNVYIDCHSLFLNSNRDVINLEQEAET